jgi:hypothetical protein
MMTIARFPIPADWDSRPAPTGFNRGVYARFRPDHNSFGKFILSEQVRDPVTEVAEAIRLLAINNTPRSGGGVRVVKGKVIGHMQDEYEVVREAGAIKVDRAFRVKVEVINKSEHSAAVEFGNRITKARRPLGRAGAFYGDFKSKAGD